MKRLAARALEVVLLWLGLALALPGLALLVASWALSARRPGGADPATVGLLLAEGVVKILRGSQVTAARADWLKSQGTPAQGPQDPPARPS